MTLGHSLGSKFCLFINQQESVWATSGQSSIQNSQNSKITTHMTLVFGCYATTDAKYILHWHYIKGYNNIFPHENEICKFFIILINDF